MLPGSCGVDRWTMSMVNSVEGDDHAAADAAGDPGPRRPGRAGTPLPDHPRRPDPEVPCGPAVAPSAGQPAPDLVRQPAACEPVCPVGAIFYEDDVPAQWKEFTAADAAFFTEARSRSAPPAGRPTSARPGARRRLRRQLPGPRQRAAQPTSRRGRIGQRRDRQLALGGGRPGRASPADVGHLDRGRPDRQGGAQLGVAVATSPPDPGQRRAELVVAGALA